VSHDAMFLGHNPNPSFEDARLDRSRDRCNPPRLPTNQPMWPMRTLRTRHKMRHDSVRRRHRRACSRRIPMQAVDPFPTRIHRSR
jgi:hypothetical protein